MPMKTLLSALTLVLTAATVVAQSDNERLFTQPTVPPREALDRLNLQLGWQIYLPMDGRKDRLYHVQITPKEMFVQTRSGLVVSLDPETGRTRWRQRVGQPYPRALPLGYNAKQVFVSVGHMLYCLDRATGRLQWQYELSDGLSAPPAADAEQVYLCLGTGKVAVYAITSALPGAEKKDLLPPPADGKLDGQSVPGSDERLSRSGTTESAARAIGSSYSNPEPKFSLLDRSRAPVPEVPPLIKIFESRYDHPFEVPPLLTSEFALAAETTGLLIGASKFRKVEVYSYQTEGPISADMGQYGDIGYIGSQDQNLYALNLQNGKMLWRFGSRGSILRAPQVTDEDVYLAPEHAGLVRLNRTSGEPFWNNTEAEQFLSASAKFVYARDRSGQLLVLEKRRGTPLGSLDVRDFVFPISNEHTDRFYLAANDGLLVCLHDRGYVKPQVMRKVPEEKLPPQEKIIRPGGKPGGDKPAGEKKEGAGEKKDGGADKEMKKEDKEGGGDKDK
jgi:hypothetical protein